MISNCYIKSKEKSGEPVWCYIKGNKEDNSMGMIFALVNVEIVSICCGRRGKR